jgi:porphobilinogen deaminase
MTNTNTDASIVTQATEKRKNREKAKAERMAKETAEEDAVQLALCMTCREGEDYGEGTLSLQ